MVSMWTSKDKLNPGCKLEAFYHHDSNEFEVVATKGTAVTRKRFYAEYRPKFGIDVCDMDAIYEIAEELSDTLKAA